MKFCDSVSSWSIPSEWLRPRFAKWWSTSLRLLAGTLMVVLPLRVLAAGEQQFGSPEAAVSALEAAAKDRDTNAMHALFGPAG
ncbi:MAG TPA: hypothetical protein VN578_24740, partial [Candidatus Binatia bacterium]|nr:hypothetical protein [Candidatus Binatia bacterium]